MDAQLQQGSISDESIGIDKGESSPVWIVDLIIVVLALPECSVEHLQTEALFASLVQQPLSETMECPWFQMKAAGPDLELASGGLECFVVWG